MCVLQALFRMSPPSLPTIVVAGSTKSRMRRKREMKVTEKEV